MGDKLLKLITEEKLHFPFFEIQGFYLLWRNVLYNLSHCHDLFHKLHKIVNYTCIPCIVKNIIWCYVESVLNIEWSPTISTAGKSNYLLHSKWREHLTRSKFWNIARYILNNCVLCHGVKCIRIIFPRSADNLSSCAQHRIIHT
jgi:hypothetical protein